MSLFTLEQPPLSVEAQDFVDALDVAGNPPIYTLSPEKARQFLIDSQNRIGAAKPDADIKDISLPVGPTGSVDVRIVKPKGAKDRMPAVLYLHGGGWVMGGKESHDRLIREISVNAGVAVIFPEYGLAPEIKYPISIEQCYAVLEYLGREAKSMGLDPDGFVVMGDSAGGNMATVLAMLSHERGGPDIIAQILLYPVTDGEMETKSYKDFAEGPWLTKKAMRWFWDAYLPDLSRREERNASPLRARDEDLEALPPTLVITAENDVLRDEGEEYARRLDEVGVSVSCVRVNGAIHDFLMLDALADMAGAKTALDLAVAEIKRAFQGIFPERG